MAKGRTNVFRLKQAGHVGAFECSVNGEAVGHVVGVQYETSIDSPPTVTLEFRAYDEAGGDGDIELEGAVVELVPIPRDRTIKVVEPCP